MARSETTKKTTRIQRQKTDVILEAALDVFSDFGFRGSTIDMIANRANLSKPNILYYFDNKEAIHISLLEKLLKTWLAPLHEINENNPPVEEICKYIEQKLNMARDFPRESKLFATEILHGAPLTQNVLATSLKKTLDEKVAVINKWISEKKLAHVNGYHLFFSIWAMTQHYADFDIQVRSILDQSEDDLFKDAEEYLTSVLLRTLDAKAP